jgi:hypothetical protein
MYLKCINNVDVCTHDTYKVKPCARHRVERQTGKEAKHILPGGDEWVSQGNI